MPDLHVLGMHGLGDCLHQRAVIRQLMQRGNVSLETSWPSVYHDLIAEGLKVTSRRVALRTQTKNSSRESEQALFTPRHPFLRANMRIAYGGQQVLQTESKTILEVMCNGTGTDYATADYRLPIPDRWYADLTASPHWEPLWRAKIASGKPLLVYRPLVHRPEWRGGMLRNAAPADYAKLFSTIRDQFFVVSIADLEPNVEWLVGPEPDADVALHRGELTFEMMAALFETADLVYTSSGFAAILGPAVETPTISVIGGYESVGCHNSGAKFAPFLALGPEQSCTCWSSQCGCKYHGRSRELNMPAAEAAVREFVDRLL